MQTALPERQKSQARYSCFRSEQGITELTHHRRYFQAITYVSCVTTSQFQNPRHAIYVCRRHRPTNSCGIIHDDRPLRRIPVGFCTGAAPPATSAACTLQQPRGRCYHGRRTKGGDDTCAIPKREDLPMLLTAAGMVKLCCTPENLGAPLIGLDVAPMK